MYVMEEICRVCLRNIPAEGEAKVDLETALESYNKTFLGVLEELIPDSQGKGNRSLPQQVCVSCSHEISSAYRLRRKVLSSEKILVNQIQKQQLLQETDIFNDIESLDSSIMIVDNVVRIQTSPDICNPSKCGNCSVTDCSRNPKTTSETEIVDSCRFCGAQKDSCNICKVDEGDIDVLSLSLPEDVVPKEVFRCSECNKEFATKSRLRKHEMTHTPDKPWHCQHCKWSFATELDLNTHTLINHASDGRNECVYCMKTFKQKRLLRQHMITHKNSKRFKCKFCEKAFNLLHHLKNHEKIHENRSDFECATCHKRFITKDRLATHVKTHQERSFRCDTCGKLFLDETSLETHRESHSGDGVLICPGCGLQFSDSSKFNRHRKSQCANGTVKMRLHEDLKHVCLVCSLDFSTEQAMREHMKSHTNQFVCPTCNKSFLKEKSLEAHLKTHSVRAFNCEFCDESFNRSDHLKNHITRKHPEQSDEDFRFECVYCNKKFVQSGELNIHMRIHTRSKPYSCGTCSKSFTQANQLKNHERLHSNERPFVCSICNHSYANSSGLMQHLASHTTTIRVMDFPLGESEGIFQLAESECFDVDG